MLLTSLLITPILGVLAILVNMKNNMFLYPKLDKGIILKQSNVLITKSAIALTLVELHSEFLNYYDSILALADNVPSIADNASYVINNVYDSVSHIPRPNWGNFGNNISHYSRDLYQRSLEMPRYSIVYVRELILSSTGYVHFSSFSPLDFRDTLIGFHSKIEQWANIRNILIGISGVICTAAGVFFNAIYKHGTPDASVGESESFSVNDQSNNSKSNFTNNSTIQQGTSASGGTSGSGDGDDNNNNNNNNNRPKSGFLDTAKSVVSRNTLIAISYIHERIINWRMNNPLYEGLETEWYGAPVRLTRNGTPHLNETVTLAQIIRYALVNSQEIVPALGTTLDGILSDSAFQRMTRSANFRTLFRGLFTGRALNNALRDYEAIKNLLGTRSIDIKGLNDYIKE